MNEKRTARLMQKEAISARNPKVFRVKTTDSNHDLPIAPDLVQRNFAPRKQNVIWVTDITYIETVDGFVYLTTVLDLGNRENVGWYLSDNLRTEGVAKALVRAIARKTQPEDLIVHSDRGVQFASAEFRDLLTENKLLQSMSRKGNCYDNAVQESFFYSLKTERLYRLGFVPTMKGFREFCLTTLMCFTIVRRGILLWAILARSNMQSKLHLELRNTGGRSVGKQKKSILKESANPVIDSF